MLGLKILVGIMSSLIVIGVITLAVVIVGRISTQNSDKPYQVAIDLNQMEEVKTPEKLPSMPENSGKITNMVGVDKLLILKFEQKNQPEKLIIINPQNGKIVGKITLYSDLK